MAGQADRRCRIGGANASSGRWPNSHHRSKARPPGQDPQRPAAQAHGSRRERAALVWLSTTQAPAADPATPGAAAAATVLHSSPRLRCLFFLGKSPAARCRCCQAAATAKPQGDATLKATGEGQHQHTRRQAGTRTCGNKSNGPDRTLSVFCFFGRGSEGRCSWVQWVPAASRASWPRPRLTMTPRRRAYRRTWTRLARGSSIPPARGERPESPRGIWLEWCAWRDGRGEVAKPLAPREAGAPPDLKPCRLRR